MKTSVHQEHGLDRGAVASAEVLGDSPGSSRWSRSAPTRCAHRRSVARSTRPPSTPSNLSSALSTVATRQHLDAVVTRAGRRPRSAWQTRSFRNVHQCQLQLGEKKFPEALNKMILTLLTGPSGIVREAGTERTRSLSSGSNNRGGLGRPSGIGTSLVSLKEF